MRIIILISVIFLVYSSTFSQVQTQQLDSLFSQLDNRTLAFGSLTISKQGKNIYQNAIGFSYISPTEKTRATPETRYRIGSVSKMFTAAMIFQLLEENKLNLDQKLSTYFPDLPNANRISVEQLLRHQSGLHDYTNNTGFETWMNRPKSQAELLQIIREKGADFEPGARNEYCNTNYLLLSYILEKISGKSYEANLQSRVVSKIKLKNTSLAKPINPQNNESVSYKYSNGNWNAVTETDPSIHSGAGAIVSTTGDLAIFINALFNGRIIAKSSLEDMMTITDGYGMGLFPFDHGTHKGYGHNGRIEEFYTATRYYLKQGITIVYCTNGINFPRTDILENIVKACFNEPIAIPFSSTVSIDPVQYSGVYEAVQMPVVTVSVKNSKLVAETQGATFELEPVSENYFMHSPSGYYFDFVPIEGILKIEETDNVYFLKKK